MSTTSTRTNRSNQPSDAHSQQTRDKRRFRTAIAVVVVLAAVLALFAIYRTASAPEGREGAPAAQSYDVGSPGVGEAAPPFALPATTGETIDLEAYRGQTVLLYFQEGLMCQPCWEQITDLEATNSLEGAGVDAMLSITTDPVDLLTQKVSDEGIATPVLSDPDLSVSREYSTNQYGMMGDSRNGHSLILVGPDGQIQWRADYGGAPDYTMYVPVEQLMADLRDGVAASSAP